METLGVFRVGKRYDGTAALTDVSFEMPKGSVLAVCGENGAGKSTLMKILAGAITPDEGEIRIDGAPVRFANPRQALEAGIHTVYQELSLLPHMSVAENILLGQMPHRAFPWVVDWHATYGAADAVLRSFGIDDIDVRRPVSDFSVSVQQMVEIAKALVSLPEVGVFTHGVIPGACLTEALGISFPGIDEALFMGPRSEGEDEWSIMSGWMSR